MIAEILALMERYAIRLEQHDALRLRKANQIKTIQSSLAIEGNTLSESQVGDLWEGKKVVAPGDSAFPQRSSGHIGWRSKWRSKWRSN